MLKINKKEKFEQMFYELFPKVKSFALKILQSEEDAEDIAQDVFVKLWSAPEIWEEEETWHRYVFTMVRNLIFNFLKHKAIEQRFQQQIEPEDINYCASNDTYNQLYAKEIRLLIKLTINRMPEQRRKIFYMSRHENLSHAEIAKKLNLSVRTVERHIYLALKELKKVFYVLLFLFLD